MKINVSSKTISLFISLLISIAVGIIAVVFIGHGDEDISFDDYSVIVYSEHDGWTDISADEQKSEEHNKSEDNNNSDNQISDVSEIISNINSLYPSVRELTEEMFSDETGIKISPISFLDDFAPENVSYSLGYVFVGDRVFDLEGNDLTAVLDGYTFTKSRDDAGNVLFEKNGKYYFLKNKTVFESVNAKLNYGELYLYKSDDEPILFESGGKWGAKNKDGEIIVKALYTKAYPFKDGIGCFVSKSNTIYIYNNTGKLITSDYKVYSENKNHLMFDNGLLMVSKDDKTIILKSSGSPLDVPSDYNIVGCKDGIAVLEKNGYTGYMNKNGKWIYPPLLNFSVNFAEGLAVVSEETFDDVFVIDREGNTVIPRGFKFITPFSMGRSLLYSEKYGWFVANKMMNV